jgi:hypothetical protein
VFNDPSVQTAISKAPATAPAAEVVTHVAKRPSIRTTRSLPPPEEAAIRTPPAQPVGVLPSVAPPVDAASPAPQPQTAQSVAVLPSATPLVEAAIQAPSTLQTPRAQSTAVRPAAAATPPERVASGEAEPEVRVVSRHSRRQYVAVHQASYQSDRRGSAGYRRGGTMARIAPYLAMAMSAAQSSGVDVGSLMGGYGGGQGGVDVRQMMGMARGMGFDPSALMGGHGR